MLRIRFQREVISSMIFLCRVIFWLSCFCAGLVYCLRVFVDEQEHALRFLTDELSHDVLVANYGLVVGYRITEVTTDEDEVYVTFKDRETGADTFLAYIMSAFVACEFALKFESVDYYG